MEDILNLLEEGRAFERGGDTNGAISRFQAACASIREELPSLASDIQLLMSKELMHYETKICELQGSDLAELLEDNVSFVAAPPPPPTAKPVGITPAPKSMKVGTAIGSTATPTSVWKGANKSKSLQRMQQKTLESSRASNVCLSELEINVLKSSSLINGHLYMPWLSGEEKEERFRFDHVFSDPAGLLPFSEKQKEAGAVYLRPPQFIASGRVHMVSTPLPNPYAITQDCVGDCSFVCSLIIASLYEQRARKRIVSGIIYPQDSQHAPVVNESGKYLVKLFLNGVFRKVLVDDRLPCRPCPGAAGAKLLCSHSTLHNELWVSIVEKAFLKVHGGYQFAGSNSGKDLYTLTGWIPEQVHLGGDSDCRSYDHGGKDEGDGRREVETFDYKQDKERVWQRMVSAHEFGDCLITVSTKKSLSVAEQSATGLIPRHAYAVLEVKQAGTLRMLKIKNPWTSNPWKGRFSSRDRDRWTKGLRKVLRIGDANGSPESIQTAFDNMERDGIFFIELDDLLQYFNGIFLNWNPDLFSFKTTIHDHWPQSLGPANDLYYRGDNPQYSLVVDPSILTARDLAKGNVVSLWVLLSRHEVSEKDEDNEIFMAVHVYKSLGGKRVYDNPRPFIKGLYSNNPHQLVRIDVDLTQSSERGADSPENALPRKDANNHKTDTVGSSSELTVVLSQMDKARDVNYSLSVYGTAPYTFSHAPPPGKFKFEFSGKFDVYGGCGTSNHNTFFLTPQYALFMPETGAATHATVHVDAFASKGVQVCLFVVENTRDGSGGGFGAVAQGKDLGRGRVDSLPTGEENGLVTSHGGLYTTGYCHCPSVKLESGKRYTVVLSTYKQYPQGSFKLRVFSRINSIRCEEVPQEGSGLTHRRVTGSFERGRHQGQKGGNKLYALLDRLVLTPDGSSSGKSLALFARLRVEGDESTPIHLGLFDNDPGLNKARVSPKSENILEGTHGGIYWDGSCGVALQYKSTWPESHARGLTLIPSCYDDTECSYVLDVYTNGPVGMRWEKQQ